jgi:hypothetical protein
VQKNILLLSIFLISCCACYAENVKPTKNIPGFNPVDGERWAEIDRDNEAILYYDKTTIKKEIIPHVRQPGEGPPVQYTMWIKGMDRARNMTPPYSYTISCQNRDKVPPESVAEKVYNHFCLSPDAQAAVYIDPSIEQQKQQQLQVQLAQAAMAKQMEEERRKAIIRGAAGTGLGILQMLPGVRGY